MIHISDYTAVQRISVDLSLRVATAPAYLAKANITFSSFRQEGGITHAQNTDKLVSKTDISRTLHPMFV